MYELLKALPKMQSGNELLSSMIVLPDYPHDICNANAPIRLIALSDIYKIYLPSQMSLEIYSKLYLALLRSLKKKGTKIAIQQQNENYKAMREQESLGILGGSDSFTIIGVSGIGKSSAISRAINLIAYNGVIEISEPYTKIIPFVIVQCPFDSSVKGLLLEILRKVDEQLETKYYQNALRVRSTTDMLIGSVSQVALNHIGLLVVDEIQNVVNNKNGKSLVGMLTQLINNSGISICMVGTPESSVFFEQAMQLARRSLGLQYNKLEFDQYFYDFCSMLFSYQYVKQRTEITPAIIEWLYEHSAGIISIVVSLVYDAQEIAILNGTEQLNLETLNEAYQKRMILLHGYLGARVKHKAQTPKNEVILKESKPDSERDFKIETLVAKAKQEDSDIVEVLKKYITIVEVDI